MALIAHPPSAFSRARRKRARNVSYVEATSSDESDSDSSAQTLVQARRSTRRNKRHSDQEPKSVSNDIDLPVRPMKRPRRSVRPNYKESDTEDDGFVDGARPEYVCADPQPPLQHKSGAGRPRRQAKTSQDDRSPTKNIRPSVTLLKRTRISKQSTQDVVPSLPPSHKILPWADLPYELLAQVLRYASYPLYDGARPCSSINWLLDVSLLCRSFHEAAISTLLRSPPLFPADRAHGLIALLDDERAHTLQVNTKIKRLDVEVRSLLIKKSGINLSHLLRQVPGLQHLRLYHNHDYFGSTVWAQPSVSKAKWAYPPELFDTLDETGILLRSWTWNGRFPNTNDVSRMMAVTHYRPAFQRLRSLALMNLAAPLKVPESVKNTMEDYVIDGLSKIPHLEELVFRNGSVLRERLILGLPRFLRRLCIVNCDEVTSPALDAFLRLGGGNLSDLRLDGNQSLDLGFLSSLGQTCPHLSTLRMDLSYSDGSAFHDVNPHFDKLLPLGPPSWPKDIQTIDLVQLRNLDAEAAESFLQSLVDAAPELRSLRVLNLKLILNLAWRERSNIRTRWNSRLERTFLRRGSDPTPFAQAERSTRTRAARRAPAAIDASLSRPSSDNSRSSTPGTDDSAPNTKRRSSRIAKVLSTKVEEDGSESEEDHLPIQGMCTFVKLALDNQRPSEIQLTEANFMDEEPEDEDWNGRDPVPRVGYAW